MANTMTAKSSSLIILGVVFVACNTLLELPSYGDIAVSSARYLRQEDEILSRPSSSQPVLSSILPLSSAGTDLAKLQQHKDDRAQIQAWRQKYSQQCQDEKSTKDDLIDTLASMMVVVESPPKNSNSSNINSNTPNQAEELTPCDFTVLDFGANIGDSLGKFIDSRIDPCPAKGLSRNPRLELERLSLGNTFHDKNNVLVRSSKSILQQVDHYPEEYCYVGIEGNPRFTHRLKALEQRVMTDAHPRPVRSAHFLTETVGAGIDGPTTLFLDTINKDRNFWGSSILETHQDVQKSVAAAAKAATTENAELRAAPVQGITLTTLLQQTVVKQKGSHVLIKMDIEGGEYAVLEEAYQSGSLCDFAQSGVTIHMILETHRPDVIGITNFDLEHWRHIKNSFRKCGVVLHKGRDAGR